MCGRFNELHCGCTGFGVEVINVVPGVVLRCFLRDTGLFEGLREVASPCTLHLDGHDILCEPVVGNRSLLPVKSTLQTPSPMDPPNR